MRELQDYYGEGSNANPSEMLTWQSIRFVRGKARIDGVLAAPLGNSADCLAAKARASESDRFLTELQPTSDLDRL